MARECWVLVLGLTWAAQAHAEPPPTATMPPAPTAAPPPSPAPPAETPAAEAPSAGAKPAPAAPDLVVLKNGNRYRGTIAELVKGEFVTIVLITGETRKIPWDEVEQAGPAEKKPARRERDDDGDDDGGDDGDEESGATPKRPLRRTTNMDARPGSHDIMFSSDRKGTRFFVRGESERAYRFICTAPCSDWLEPQAYAMAIRVDDDDEMIEANTVAIDGPTRVLANYRDRSGVRGAGFLVMTISAAVLGLTYLYAQDEASAAPVIVSGATTGIVGVMVGIGLAAASDGVVIRTSPLSQ